MDDNEIDKQIESEIAEALKPMEAVRRPFISLRDPPAPAPMNTVLGASQAQEEPIQTAPTVTQRLHQLMEENGRLQGRIDALQEDLREMEARVASLILRVLAILE